MARKLPRFRPLNILLVKKFRDSSSRTFPIFTPCFSNRNRPWAADAPSDLNGEEVAALQAIEHFIGQKIPRLKLENFPYLYTVLFEPESAVGGRRAIRSEWRGSCRASGH